MDLKFYKSGGIFCTENVIKAYKLFLIIYKGFEHMLDYRKYMKEYERKW